MGRPRWTFQEDDVRQTHTTLPRRNQKTTMIFRWKMTTLQWPPHSIPNAVRPTCRDRTVVAESSNGKMSKASSAVHLSLITPSLSHTHTHTYIHIVRLSLSPYDDE